MALGNVRWLGGWVAMLAVSALPAPGGAPAATTAPAESGGAPSAANKLPAANPGPVPPLAPTTESAPAPPPRIPTDRITYDFTVGARYNPLGLEALYNLAYRRRLYASDSPVLRDNNFSVGISPTLSPGIVRMGGFVEFRPLTILTLHGAVHNVGYPGAFNMLQQFRTLSEDYGDKTLRDRQDDPVIGNKPESGLEVMARANLLAKVGPIVLRNDLLFTYVNMGVPEELGPLFYNQRFDMMLQDRSWFMHQDTDVLYFSDFGLVAGARLGTSHTFVSEENLGGEEFGDRRTQMRLGPLAAYTFHDEPGTRWNKPTAILALQWWLMHPWRTGEDSSQGIPMITAAFRFEGDLFRSDD
jgi:hypothetical protein